jgi:hypothetical protein
MRISAVTTILAVVVLAAFVFVSVMIIPANAQETKPAKTPADAQTSGREGDYSAAAFEAIVPVLRHPRCMNCHSAGDYPRQGDDRHRHSMQVRRGPNGNGVNVVGCSSCHQDHNLTGLRMPPGAPDWRLPPPEMPMIWEDLSDQELCELFKDPTKNGGRDVEQIVEHMRSPLVLWGWNPGEGRTPVPLPQHEFQAKVQQWASHGAVCPTETTAPQ